MYYVARGRYHGSYTYNVTSEATGYIACYDEPAPAFDCADMANRCRVAGMSERHSAIVARAYSGSPDVFTDGDACAAIEAADLAAGGA